jgi:hypothetical protein
LLINILSDEIADSQCARLREAFDSNPYLSKGERVKLAEALDITEDNVSVSLWMWMGAKPVLRHC